MNFLRMITGLLYGSGIGNYPPFKQMYFAYKKYLLARGLRTIDTKEDFKMQIGSSTIEDEIALTGQWEGYITKLIQDNINEGDTVIDLGANIGWHSLVASKKCGAKGRVVAFEPCQRNRDKLLINIGLNNVKNISVVPYGAGNENQEAEIFYDSVNPGATSIVGLGKEKEIIKVIRIDDHPEIINDVEFIKIDIEGFEYEALKGAERLINRSKPVVIFEFSPIFYKRYKGDGHREYSLGLLNFFSEKGYSLMHIDSVKRMTESIGDNEKYLAKILEMETPQSDIIAFPRS